jgi:hypothetical protein
MLFGALVYFLLYLTIPLICWVKFDISWPMRIYFKILLYYFLVAIITFAAVGLTYIGDNSFYQGINASRFNYSAGVAWFLSLSGYMIFLAPIFLFGQLAWMWVELNLYGGFILYTFEILSFFYIFRPLNFILNIVFDGIFYSKAMHEAAQARLLADYEADNMVPNPDLNKPEEESINFETNVLKRKK